MKFSGKTQTTTPSTTIVTAATPGELSTLEAAMMDACNEMHEARATGQTARAADIRGLLLDLLRRYDESDADNHPNPAWARPNQRALVLSALGDVDAAVDAERIALRYADTPRRREISLDNLCDRSLRLKRYEEAVGYFLAAAEVAPASVPVMLNGAQALFMAGFKAESQSIFAALLAQPEQLSPTGPLGAYLDHEPRLAHIAPHLPALAELFSRWNALKASAASNGGSL